MDDADVLAGRYRRVSRLGRGGMGEVWLAVDDLLERQVAIKRIHTVGDPDPTSLERMMREARLAARLDHPNAVTIHDVVLADGHPHLVMQYVAGTTLAALPTPLDVAEAGRITGEVAAALAEAHRLGIVHRDVKPSNVLIDGRGRALLADFGIARSASDTRLTQTGAFIGTPGYLAPELARGEDASPASDVYALGATLYAVVEGHAPHDDGSPNTLAVLARVLTLPVPPPTRAGPLTGLLQAMLAADPRARPNAADIAQHLSSTPAAHPAPAPQTAPTLVRPTVQPATLIAPHQAQVEVVDPLSTLAGALDYAEWLTGGRSGGMRAWGDLINDEIAPALRFDDHVDLFAPVLFVVDDRHSGDLPRRITRSLRTVRPGVAVCTADRLICAWNYGYGMAQHFSVTIAYDTIRVVSGTEFEEDGENYRGVGLACATFVWAILFDGDRDLDPLDRLLVGRMRGSTRPRWNASGVVEAWLVADGSGGWRAEPGWPLDQ